MARVSESGSTLQQRHTLALRRALAAERRAEAAEARCARLQQALTELLPYAQLDDPWSGGIENYRWLLAQAREALAGLDA